MVETTCVFNCDVKSNNTLQWRQWATGKNPGSYPTFLEILRNVHKNLLELNCNFTNVYSHTTISINFSFVITYF